MEEITFELELGKNFSQCITLNDQATLHLCHWYLPFLIVRHHGNNFNT